MDEELTLSDDEIETLSDERFEWEGGDVDADDADSDSDESDADTDTTDPS